jgi:hypothetical protein
MLWAISSGLLGALIMFVIIVVDNGAFETASQLRNGPLDRTWLNPASFLVHSHQEGVRKGLQHKCDTEAKAVERAIFIPSICTIDRSRTCVMGRLRWTGREIRAPLVSEDFYDYPSLGDRFSTLGTGMLRFQLSESGHALNEALSNGAVDFEHRTVDFGSEALARDYLGKISGVCGALYLKAPTGLILD